MSSSVPNSKTERSDATDELAKQAIRLANALVLPMTLKSAIELNVIKVLSRAGPEAFLTPSQIAVEIGATRNPNAPVLLDRMLNLLASYSVLKCCGKTGEDGVVERVYGVSPICQFFTENEDGGSVTPLFLLQHDMVVMKTWYHLNDLIMEGGVPLFDREYGMNMFEYTGTDPRFNQAFNKAMSSHTTMLMNKVLSVYKGFQGVKVLVDVGGGVGVTLGMITAKYPNIKGINFDLPHVIATAHSSYPGVEHIGGDMFSEVPKGDAIFMKWILHDWSDEHCLKLLKNCYEVLPHSGKVIIVESILPEVPDDRLTTNIACEQDMFMLAGTTGGKERRLNAYDALAKGAGFSGCLVVVNAYNSWIMEFTK